MSSKRTSTFAMGLAAILAALLTACAGPVTAPPPQVIVETQIVQATVVVPEEVEVVVTNTPAPFKPEGTLTIGLTTNVTAIEVGQAPERQSVNASWTMFDSLVFPEPDGSLSPALAESWDVSEDGTTITFHLREGVTFHNGEPLTADAVVYSWETYSQPEVANATLWVIADKVEKIDDMTVAVSTEEPNALLLPAIGQGWSIIPPEYHQEVGLEGFAEHPVGTGPFMFGEWVKSDHLTVVANPDYWREGYPKVAEVVFKFMPESATRVAAVQTGEIDIAPRLTSDDISDLLGAPGVTILRYPVNRSYYMAFNNITTGVGSPIEDPLVRQAMAHALDIDAIIDALFSGFATRSVGMVGPTDLGYDAADPIPYDPDRARELLTEAGYPNGFEIDLACPDGAYPHINEVCQAMRSYFDEVGVTGDLQIMEANAFWDAEAGHELELFVDSSSHGQSEAYTRLVALTITGTLWSMWSDPELDAMFNQVAVTVDTEERAALYGQIQERMRDNPPFIYLYYPETFEGVRTRVFNYAPRAAENYYLYDVSVSDAE